MSTVTEDQTIPMPTAQVTSSSEENTTMTCGICGATINDSGTKLVCPNDKCGNWTCNACIQLMIDAIFSEPALHYPLSCGACENSFDMTQIEQTLVKQERYEQLIACLLPLFWSEDCLEKNEKLAQCMYFNRKVILEDKFYFE